MSSTSSPQVVFTDPRAHNRRLVQAIVLLACVVLGGTLGFVVIEDWDPWRAFYFTLITVTTVGYGDEGISEPGRKLAAVLLIGGIVAASYTFALLMQQAATQPFAWRHRMQKRIDRLRGHTIVCGFGRMGRAVCELLAAEGASFVVIERSPELFQKVCETGHLVVQGSAIDDEVLIAAGVERAAHIVPVIGHESENIAVTLSARDLSANIVIISRAEGKEEIRKLMRAGADRTVSPFLSGGAEIANSITRPNVAAFLTRTANGDVSLAEIKIEEGAPLVGRTLKDYGKEEGQGISFVALQRVGDEKILMPPGGGATLQPGDLLIVAGHSKQVAIMDQRARATRKRSA